MFKSIRIAQKDPILAFMKNMRESSKDGQILRSALHLNPDYTYLWRQCSALAMFPIAKWHVLAKPSGHLRTG